MADNKNKQDGRDDTKIDPNDANEVSYAAKEFGVSSSQLKEAINQVGNSRAKLKAHFNK
jgi:hypothetical protein